MGVWADVQVKGKISATKISGAVTYDLTLHGSANGLLPFTFENTEAFAAREGAYSGLAVQDGTKRRTGRVTPLSMILNSTTKAFLGKFGQYLYLEVKTYEDNGSTVISTETAEMRIETANRVDAINAASRVIVGGPMEAYAIA